VHFGMTVGIWAWPWSSEARFVPTPWPAIRESRSRNLRRGSLIARWSLSGSGTCSNSPLDCSLDRSPLLEGRLWRCSGRSSCSTHKPCS
jgi:hypothetical protein